MYLRTMLYFTEQEEENKKREMGEKIRKEWREKVEHAILQPLATRWPPNNQNRRLPLITLHEADVSNKR